MNVLTYTDARAHLKDVMDRAIHDQEEVVVTRRNNESVVVVSLETWNSITETLYLLSTPRNAERLRKSVTQLNADSGTEQTLVD